MFIVWGWKLGWRQDSPNLFTVVCRYILRHCITIVLILQKNHINPSTFIFWITMQIYNFLCKYPLIAPFDIVVLWYNCYPVLALFEQSDCIEWIIFVIYCHWPKYRFSGTTITCYILSFGKLLLNPVHFHVWKLNQTVLELDFWAVNFCSSLDET
jgi:hypothetical protein